MFLKPNKLSFRVWNTVYNEIRSQLYEQQYNNASYKTRIITEQQILDKIYNHTKFYLQINNNISIKNELYKQNIVKRGI